jgi:mRNA interferase RelE/StbE
MKATFRKSFVRDVKKIKSQKVLDHVRLAIEGVEAAQNLASISDLKKLAGTGSFYRIRIGDFRIGVSIAKGTVDFVRCLHRGDIYRNFP